MVKGNQTDGVYVRPYVGMLIIGHVSVRHAAFAFTYCASRGNVAEAKV